MAQFYVAARRADGLAGYCKKCQTVQTMKWASRHPEKRREASRRSHARHREKRNAKSREWYSEHVTYRREWALKRKYGLTLADFDALLAKQGGKCGFCLQPLTPDMFVDHDHVTNKVRGIVHPRCNNILRTIDDDPSALARWSEYLKNPPASR